jgi:cytochrome c oxidase cbb3-type subunit 3
MNEFTSNFWSLYVAGITAAGVLGCLVLLWVSGKTKAMTSKDNTTGHVWDGDLREMNNPLPRWWVGLFIITCIFAVVYLILYPGMGSFGGLWNWSSHDQFDREVARGNEQVAPIYAAFAGKSIEDLSRDPAARAIGDRLFMNNCSQCHGSDARGANTQGFPDLTDTQWNWGGTPDAILTTITQGRTGVMTPMAEAVGTPEDVRNVASYVLSLSGKVVDPEVLARAKLGSEKFALCAACHGPEGKGMKELGSANLAAGIFVYGPVTEDHVINQINNGRTGVMPAWESKFTPEQLRVLAAYVWGKGGGESAAAAAN